MDAILADADAKVQRIREDTAETIRQRTQKAHSEVQAYMDGCARQDAADAADIIARRKVAAGMDGKKALLATKRELLDTVRSRLVERLVSLPHDDYLHLIDILLVAYAEEGDTVLLAKDCAVTYGDVQSLEVCRTRALKVEYDADVRSGILLSGRTVDRDLGFEAVAADVFAANEMELATRLFGKA